jgi:uridine kinase
VFGVSGEKPFVIGVAGGSGSGKSTVADRVIAVAGRQRVAVLSLDSYYCSQSHLAPEARVLVNYDHPNAFDWALLRLHLSELRAGRSVDVPVYDFATYDRTGDTSRVQSGPIIVVEGLLVLWDADLADLMDLRVFVDADPDVRFIRRLHRDISVPRHRSTRPSELH